MRVLSKLRAIPMSRLIQISVILRRESFQDGHFREEDGGTFLRRRRRAFLRSDLVLPM